MNANFGKKRLFKTSKTRKKILENAADLFAKNGFDGTSLSQIAKKARVNQSLIYHYFESKADLWKSVKIYYAESYASRKELQIDTDNDLKAFLGRIIHHRLEFYANHPEIIRMIAWQKLEPEKNKLAGGTRFSPDNWKEVFASFQKKGKIKADANLDMMILFITSLIAGIMTEDYLGILTGQENKQLYINLIIDSSLQTFGCLEST